MQRIVTSERLSVEEVDVFRACGRWALAEFKRRQQAQAAEGKADSKAGAAPTAQDLRDVLGGLFYDIRFPQVWRSTNCLELINECAQISVTDLATVITPSGMLSGEELVELCALGVLTQSRLSR